MRYLPLILSSYLGYLFNKVGGHKDRSIDLKIFLTNKLYLLEQFYVHRKIE